MMPLEKLRDSYRIKKLEDLLRDYKKFIDDVVDVPLKSMQDEIDHLEKRYDKLKKSEDAMMADNKVSNSYIEQIKELEGEVVRLMDKVGGQDRLMSERIKELEDQFDIEVWYNAKQYQGFNIEILQKEERIKELEATLLTIWENADNFEMVVDLAHTARG